MQWLIKYYFHYEHTVLEILHNRKIYWRIHVMAQWQKSWLPFPGAHI